VVLLTVIVNMVVKPTGQNGWFWGMLAVMVLAIAAVICWYLRSEQQQVPVPATD
jgi:Na+/melibiose symporter-like transporter